MALAIVMRILILGSGGREHALAWKLASEMDASNIFVAPGNGGTRQCATNVPISLTDFEAILDFCKEHDVNILIPGSEDPIAAGIRNFIEERDPSIYVFSPDSEAAQLESSKDYAKEFMMRHEIPTAAYSTFTADTVRDGEEFLERLSPPYVLKADGLAAGKGVLIIKELDEAKAELRNMLLDQKFGAASSKVVIEEFLDGIEFSVFALTDGKDYVLLPEAKDYKRIGEGDTGLNTGGMGAVSPVHFFSGSVKQKTIEEVVEPTIKGFAKDGLNYRGFVFFGLINVDGQPKVIEYNVRMGDPETEVVIPRLKSSLSALVDAARRGQLKNTTCEFEPSFCTTVMSVSGGYPEAYEKGKHIEIPDHPTLFHAGTKMEDDQLVTSGGRVLAASAFGNRLETALKASYALTDQIQFDGRYFRKDIGQDLIQGDALRKIWSYLSFSSSNKTDNKYLSMMHGINRISLLTALVATVILIVKCAR